MNTGAPAISASGDRARRGLGFGAGRARQGVNPGPSPAAQRLGGQHLDNAAVFGVHHHTRPPASRAASAP